MYSAIPDAARADPQQHFRPLFRAGKKKRNEKTFHSAFFLNLVTSVGFSIAHTEAALYKKSCPLVYVTF